MQNIHSDLGFQETTELPDGFRHELKNISHDIPRHARAASLFHDFFGDFGLREIVNASRRQQSDLDTWTFEYRWSAKGRTKSRRHEAQTIIYFRSKLIQFPTLVAMPGAFIKWPGFVTRTLPILDQPDLFPSHPQLRYTCGFYGDQHQSFRSMMSEDVLTFLESRRETIPNVVFSRALPPGFETCNNHMVFYRTWTVVPPDKFEAFLIEAEQLLRLLSLSLS